MNKKELREKLAADAENWVRENGKPDLYAGQSSPQEHFRLCGYEFKRKTLKPHDVRQTQYQEWLQEARRARM
jgi:hypothetical protein